MKKYMPQADKDGKTIPVTPPDKHCDSCYFFTHHGNYEENFCGLYMRHTNNDTTPKGKHRFEKIPKPKFCHQATMQIRIKK
jgi:hypothetical protein